MHYLRMIGQFIRVSAKEETAYALNFWISLVHALLNLAGGVIGLLVLFNQVTAIQGWTFASTLALLGVYLVASALRSLFIGPSLESLAGMDGEVWVGTLDFSLMRPVNIQFLASLRKWRLFALIDLGLGLGVLFTALLRTGLQFTFPNLLNFAFTMLIGIAVLYAVLLFFTALVFWSPGFLYTWVFNGLFQMARYPLGLYPGWLKLVLTWIIPVGVITTVPVQALTGSLPPLTQLALLVQAVLLIGGASWLFHRALRRYNSASS